MQLRTAPWQIKLATALSLLVLIVKASDEAMRIASDPEATAATSFGAMWIGVAAVANLVTALLIFQAANRRKWARIGILVWTVASWSLWFLYPPSFDQYSVWAVRASIAMPLFEACALLLLFSPKGSAWYSPAA